MSRTAHLGKIAHMLMDLEAEIWRSHGWRSGDDVKDDILKLDLRKALERNRQKTFPGAVYLILEQSNYHTLNAALLGIGAFKVKHPWNNVASRKDYAKFVKAGSRTKRS